MTKQQNVDERLPTYGESPLLAGASARGSPTQVTGAAKQERSCVGQAAESQREARVIGGPRASSKRGASHE